MRGERIIILDPPDNCDSLRAHTQEDPGLQLRLILNIIASGINSLQYPRVLDLCSGEGYVAYILRRSSWSDITCVDVSKPVSPFIQDAQWRYWDLLELGRSIATNKEIPEEIRQYKNSFDIVTMVLGLDFYFGVLPRYFLKPNGIACVYPWTEKLLHDDKHWELVPKTTDLLRFKGN